MRSRSAFTFLICFLTSFIAHSSEVRAVKIKNCADARLEKICWQQDGLELCRTQLFIFGEEAKNHFLKASLSLQANSRGEVILPELRNIPGSSDLVDTTQAYRTPGRIFYVKDFGNEMLVESFWTTQPSGGVYVQQGKVGDYLFNSCQ